MLTVQEIALIFALVALVGVGAVGRLGRRKGGAAKAEPGAAHRIRALEADLRVAQRKAEEAELALEKQREEAEGLRTELARAQATLAEHEGEVARLRQSLTDECGKTQKLRQELTTRAEETIRASVRVKDAETELSVARAGSDAVMEQVQRLAAEREELTGRLRVLQSELTTRGVTPKVTRLPLRDPKER